MELATILRTGGNLSQEQLSQLALIISLDLSGCSLTEFPSPLFSSPSHTSARALQNLLCAGNKIRKIPREILQLESLTTLYLSHNAIGFLPALNHLPSLTSLHASENRLTDFPICLPGSLVTLDLSRNMITAMPPDIEHLVQ